MFSPDLTQTIIHTFYNFFSHNYVVLVYLFGTFLSAILSLIKPNRFHLLLLLGFLLLAFTFEYDKHLIEPLRNQTLQSILGSSESQVHPKVNRLVDLAISELAPIVLYIFGWGLIFLAIIVKDNSKRTRESPPNLQLR